MTLFSMQCMMPRERHDMKHGRGQSTAKNMYAKIRKNERISLLKFEANGFFLVNAF